MRWFVRLFALLCKSVQAFSVGRRQRALRVRKPQKERVGRVIRGVLRVDGPDVPSVREEFERAFASLEKRFEEWKQE